MDWKVAATLAVTAALAFTGYLATYWTNRRLAERATRLERVDLQLRDLCGPLLALVTASARSWEAFRRRYKPEGGSYWDGNVAPIDEKAEAWRSWMQQVFIPLNENLEKLVITKADLLDFKTQSTNAAERPSGSAVPTARQRLGVVVRRLRFRADARLSMPENL